MTALADALRRLALHQDIPECAQAADEIERLRGLVAEAHRLHAIDHPIIAFQTTCSCGEPLAGLDERQIRSNHAAHVDDVIDDGAR